MIPVFDLRDYDKDPEGFSAAFGKAFHDFGFVRVRGHGVPKSVIDAAENSAREFFKLPESVKDQSVQKGSEGLIGYSRNHETARGQTVPDLKEQWNIRARLAPGHALTGREDTALDVSALPQFSPDMKALYAQFESLTRRAVKPLARYMGEGENYFDKKMDRSLSMMRLLHYPQKGTAANHLDLNFLTWLRAEKPGLYVTGRDGTEHAVVAEGDELILNGGMMLGLLTNNDLKPSWHRVVAADPRQTIVFFANLNPDMVLTPLQKFRGRPALPKPDYFPPAGPDGHPSMRAGDFVAWQVQKIRKPGSAPGPKP